MPIRIVVGYAPGGAPDSIARTLAKGLSPILGQTVYVENKPGAASLLGARYVANAPADGYMLYMADNPTHVMVKHLVSGLSFDPVKDFSTVALIGGPPMILLASGKSGIRSVADLIKLAQASPGKLSYGSTGVGGVHHMVMEIFNHKAGISVTHIPYKGSGQSIPALMGGEIDLLLVGLNSYLPMRNDPRVRAIGFTSSGRLEECPDVPPLSDFVPGFEFASDLGVLAPAGIPPDVQTKLSLSIKEALATREVTEGLKAMAIKVTYMGPAQYSDYLGQVSRKFEEAVQQIGLELTPPSK